MPLRRLPLAAAVLLLLPALARPASDPTLIDDFTPYPYLWKVSPGLTLDNPLILPGDPLARPGQSSAQRVLSLTGPFHASVEIRARACRFRYGFVSALVKSSPDLDVRSVDPRSVTLGGAHAFHYELLPESHGRHQVVPTELELLFAGEGACAASRGEEPALSGRTFDGRSFAAGGPGARALRPYVASSDWSHADGLRFWFYGRNTGDQVKLELRDNRAPDPGPAGWRLAWHDEFRGPAGQSFDARHWTPEIGDGTANGIAGWGNNEREYYTGNAANASLDGAGHLAISVRPDGGAHTCYYGPCEFTSARLVTQDKVEIGHGRIEARIKVPAGSGLWPAFWALGSNIGQVGWPSCGEIDMMEFVGKNPNGLFGTLHGPGYSGGNGKGGSVTLPAPLADDFHVFAIEWQHDSVAWSVDGNVYATVLRTDVGSNPWVFDKPFFMILNVAVGGNLGGPVDPNLTYPRSMLVDYIRVFEAPDSAERFESSFADDFLGWQQLTLPFSSFVRSAAQPANAPDDGLTLREIWGYGFRLPGRGLTANPLYLDEVRLVQPSSYVVTNANDQGPGSLRDAVLTVAGNGLVSFAPGMAGATITLSSGPLWLSSKTVTIDAGAVPGITVQGSGDRLLIIDADAAATVRGLSFANGFAWDLAGGILSNGQLQLDHVVVRNNVAQCGGSDWWKGGGGIYVGGGGSLLLRDSTIRDNVARNSDGSTGDCNGGAIFVFMNAGLTIERSTISGNAAANVGGGIRMLGSGSITNSTISGNSNQGWMGSGVFHTDGVLSIVNSTITANTAPPGNGAVFVGTFTAANATLSLANTIVAGNSDAACFFAPWGAGTVTLTSVGHDVYGDASCFPVATDQIVAPMLGPLADNGGPTQTHALLLGSPAIDTADPLLCPATDERGVTRPQGAGCDVGAFELAP